MKDDEHGLVWDDDNNIEGSAYKLETVEKWMYLPQIK